MALTRGQRIIRQARGLEVDRIPSLGGWIMGARNLSVLAGVGLAEYLTDPDRYTVAAHLKLDVDGMVSPIFPRTAEEMRSGSVTEENYHDIEPEAIATYAETLPDTEREALRGFDAAATLKSYRDYFDHARAHWGGMAAIPNFWDLGGHFPLYHQFGYVAFLQACSLYPEAVGKIWWQRSLHSRERAKILAPLYAEYDLPPLLFCGEDLATNYGPMVKPTFLRRHYMPTVAMILEPLVNTGVRAICHCDGDVRPLLQDFMDAGFSGFQGFQYEDHIDIYDLRKLRSTLGEEPLIFAGMSVTRTLPFGTPDDVRDEIDYFIDATDGGRGLFLISSNVIGVEVPAENTRAGYEYIKTYDPRSPRPVRHRAWPWGVSHPESFSTKE